MLRKSVQKTTFLLVLIILIIMNISIILAENISITTSKKGYATDTGWEWISSDIEVGYDDNLIVNNVAHRGFAWFDIPNAVQKGVITSAKITVQVKDISEWNDLLSFVNLYDLGSRAWSDFYDDRFGYGWPDGHWDILAGSNFHDSATKSSTLTFDLYGSPLSGKSQMGFSFKASPEIPDGIIGDQSNKITLNNPTLNIEYSIISLPSKPINPYPSNGATNMGGAVNPSWSNGGGATSYKVYFGTDSSQMMESTKENKRVLHMSRAHYLLALHITGVLMR